MNDTQKIIIGIGTSGLVGSRIKEILEHSYHIIDLSRETGFNLLDQTTISFSHYPQAGTVLLLAAKTDVDSCEKDKSLGKEGEAWKINVEGTERVIEACKRERKRLLYFSTDFVFGGDDTPEMGYIEESNPHPMNWYAETKYQAEERVKNSGLEYLILRIAYPYRAKFEPKKDFVRAILGRLQNNQPIKAITDHYCTPTFIDDIARAVKVLLETREKGIVHVVGSQTLTPYDAALEIARVFGCDERLISQTTRSEYFAEKAPRPFNLTMNNDKIQRLGVRMRSFVEGLQEVKSQMADLHHLV